MASKRDLVEAHSFNRRRLVTAFVSGAPGGREVEPVRYGRTLIGGLVLAGMVLAGAAVSGYLKPAVPDDWLEKGLVVGKTSGSRFVAFEGTLYPVINTTSARLILSQDGQMPVTFVPDDRINAAQQGPTIGIPGAPDTLPEPGELVGSGWIACTESGNLGQGIDVTLRDPEAVRPEPGGALLVQSQGDEYVVSGGYRYPVPDDSSRTPVLRALGLDGEAPVTVPGLWVDLFPEAEVIAPFDVPASGSSVETGVVGLVEIGQPVQIDGRPYLVLSRDELVALTDFAYAVYLSSGDWEGREDLEVSSAEVTDFDTVTDPGRRPYPDTWPESMVTPFSAPDAPCARLTTSADTSDASAGDAPPTVELALARTDTVLPESRDVTRDVTVGTGAVVRAWNGGSLERGAAFLVDPTGTSYALGRADTLEPTMAALGYAEVAPVPVPAAWIDLFADGPLLSPETASQSPDSQAQLGDPAQDPSAGPDDSGSTPSTATTSTSSPASP